MSPSGRAPGASLPFRAFPAWRAALALRARSNMVAAAFGPFARKVMSLSALTALGQASFVIALPVLSRLYTPSDFGLFTIYLSIVNIGGPIVGLKFEICALCGPHQTRSGYHARTINRHSPDDGPIVAESASIARL